MIQAIVFLPLIGAIIAGLISIVGAHARNPSGDEVELHADEHHGVAVDEDASLIHTSSHEPDSHGNDDHHAAEPPAAGSRAAELITTGLLMVAAVLSWVALVDVGFGHDDARISLFPWINSGDLQVSWALRIDTLTAVMLVVVNTISSLVHDYSIGYMDEDPYRPRFFSYLSLFIFAVFMLIGSVDYETIFAAAPGLTGKTINFFGWQADALTLTCLLLFMGAMGKSAQFLLHTWLPDAMEGPTPVSALIHAATMVTAGVFMVARLSPLFDLAPTAQAFVTFIGATTAFFAATIGLVQTDIKRVVAYSTCSQLGYMFAAEGVGAYNAGIFHLFTHASFKALLFLGAGAVIHALHHEHDLRRMGTVRKV